MITNFLRAYGTLCLIILTSLGAVLFFLLFRALHDDDQYWRNRMQD